MCIFLITIQSIEHRVRLLIFRKQLPNVISEFGKLKRKINQTIVSLIDAGDDTHIKRQDEVYADLLRQMRSEFDIEGVSIDSISRCTTQLANILHNQNVDELYALTNLYGDSWLTRNMLLYLIRTIQIADKINNENNKLRVFLRNSEGNNSDTEAYNSVKSLHEGFLPIKELKLNEFRNKFPSSMDAFLYLKLSNSELFWYIERFETKLVWNGANSSTNNDTATEIKSIVNHLKSI
ncbi:hypothetical protein [Winogradskyella sp.]|uniref:hypothetical protein n=1 Tax=Winogradskyella sp. TaxID=1883156 RepID=UPI002621134A|nr:hypothetical protein [Winogradskyella sp.]